MPRSAKRKPPPKDPPPGHPMYKHQSSSHSISNSSKETENVESLIISRAISSGQKHGINLIAGTPNGGAGNCAIESVLLNINDRVCFTECFPFTHEYYRRLWVTDFKNRHVDNPNWNYFTAKEWDEGWSKMMEPGVYEQDYFGDMMLYAIACGSRKVILLFNTHLESLHDPISVCDPKIFGIRPSSSVPVVLAYDMVHYESLHPVTPMDIDKTKELVSKYQSGLYTFSRADLPYLLNSTMVSKSSRVDVGTEVKETGTSNLSNNEEKIEPSSNSKDDCFEMEEPGSSHEDRDNKTKDNGQNNEDCMQGKGEKCIPKTLKDKKLKDMNPEERKAWNAARKRKSRQNEDPVKAIKRKLKEANVKAMSRASENETNKKQRLADDASKTAERRKTEANEVKKKRKANDSSRATERRKKETCEEKKKKI